jgi:hypothetical protein
MGFWEGRSMRLALCAILFLAVVGSSGCATIVTGKYQTVMVTSDPPGVKVRTETGESIETPGQFALQRNKDHVLVAQYADAEPQQRRVKHGLQGWFFGNILFGGFGIITGVVDLASGSADKLTPTTVHFNFSETGQVVAKKHQEYLKAHSDVKPEVQVAIENEVAVKGMTKEQLIASLGVPDQIAEEGGYDKFTYKTREPKCYFFKNGTLEKTE